MLVELLKAIGSILLMNLIQDATQSAAAAELEASRRRSYAFSGTETDLDRSLPQYHSHRASRVKIEIPGYHLRGTGYSSYHVYTVQV